MNAALSSRPARALFGLLLLVALPYAFPPELHLPFAPAFSVRRLRLLSPRESAGVDATRLEEPTAVGALPLVTGTNDLGTRAEGNVAAADLPKSPKQPLDDPSGHALDAFFGALARTERKEEGATTRIAYFGDSVVAADWITSTLRRRLQARFGDAGHGYVLPANAWPGYFHQDVARFASKGWKASRVVGPFDPDGIYGLGGVALVADGPGTFATVATVPPEARSTIGHAVSRFHVGYRTDPTGGNLRLSVDGQVKETRSTRGERPGVAGVTLEVPDGPHKLEVRSMGDGPVTVLGVELERAGPGVVVDALGIVGCRVRFLDKIANGVLREEWGRRKPDLLVLAYGANESEDGFAYPMADYERTARAVIVKLKAASPGTSCLLVGPMDRADKKGDGYVTRPVIPELARIQRALAAELGCAYFDTFRAMGGHGSMGVWVQRGLGGKDLVHPTTTGAAVLAEWIEAAILSRYADWQATAPPAAP